MKFPVYRMIAPQPQKFTQVALLLLALVTIVNMTGMVDVLVDSDDTRISSLADEENDGGETLKEGEIDTSSSMKILSRRFAGCVSNSKRICWFILLLSIFTETWATTIAKYASDRSSASLLALSCALVILSQCGLTASLAQIDVGVAYAMWAALGTATVSLLSFLLFEEELDSIKVGCLMMIVLGVGGLHLREDHD